MAVIRAGHETDADLAIVFKNLCLAHNDIGDHDRAIQDCDQAISLNPIYVEAFLFRGHAYFNKGDNDRAIQDYDQAITLGSQAASTFVERGAAYHRKGDETHAIEDLPGPKRQ
jgi:tetratricopeptide (TPR) repeat protein